MRSPILKVPSRNTKVNVISGAGIGAAWSLKVKKMTEQQELVQDIRERLGEMQSGTLPFDLLAFATTIGQGYSMTVDEIIPFVRKEADALDVNYHVQSSSG
jgi:hypothetical protein